MVKAEGKAGALKWFRSPVSRRPVRRRHQNSFALRAAVAGLRLANEQRVESISPSWRAHREPGGIGEPATALFGPAVGNTVFAATGKRLRMMPMTAEKIAAA